MKNTSFLFINDVWFFNKIFKSLGQEFYEEWNLIESIFTFYWGLADFQQKNSVWVKLLTYNQIHETITVCINNACIWFVFLNI